MTDPRTERALAAATALDSICREWFRAGADAERARIQAVEQQLLPGHEELIARLMYDGETTGGQAAIEVLAAERKRREDLVPTVTQKLDPTMSDDQVAAIAHDEWKKNPKLSQEFTEASYTSFRQAEAAGRIRVLDKRKEN